MKKTLYIFTFYFLFLSATKPQTNWGWYGHSLINRLAVFTLPEEMLPLYKTEIEYLTEHAVDADRRRFIAPAEGFRHYINLDKWTWLPEDKTEAQIFHTDISIITSKNDTFKIIDYQSIRKQKRFFYLKANGIKKLFRRDSVVIADTILQNFVWHNFKNLEHDTPLSIAPDSLIKMFRTAGLLIYEEPEKNKRWTIKSVFATDRLTQNGILPYHLQTLQRQLTNAFITRNKQRILRISADIGHYIADAHVPLHTTANYDGQLTNQRGIHQFWESRLPELFAEARYNFFVGQANYIEQPRRYYWDIIHNSNHLAVNVLEKEKLVSAQFEADKKYCLETKNGIVVQKTCPEYAEAFHNALNGMVETQMRNAILALGSVWYSAWIDAGQPDLNYFKEDKEEAVKDTLPNIVTDAKMLGRDEGN